jgi:diguanylate cyclase (GGDEF)-like protein/PAS domain S-box-containing protein
VATVRAPRPSIFLRLGSRDSRSELPIVGFRFQEALIFIKIPIESRTKANVAIGLALAALIGMGCLSMLENRNLLEADRWVSHTHEILETSASLRAHLSDAGMARRLFLQGIESQADIFRAASRATLTDFQALRKLTADNGDQQKRLDRLRPIVEDRLAVLEKSITVHTGAKKDEALQKDLTDQSASLLQQFVEQSREFDNVEKDLLGRRSKWASEGARKASIVDFALTLSVFCFVLIAVVLLNRELMHRKRAEQKIAHQNSLLQSILDTCTDAIVVADNTAKIILRNPTAIRFYGDALDRVSEASPGALGFYRSDETTLLSYQDLPLWRALNGHHVDNFEMCVRPPDQSNSRWVLASSRPLLDGNAKPQGGVVFYHDISDRKALEGKLGKYAQKLECSNLELQMAQAALKRLALVDELTGLHNRRGFLSLAEQSISLAKRSQQSFVLLFIDLDGLKQINDRLGHSVGNHAIKDAAMILTKNFRESDVLSRLGGDEFAVLMVDADQSSANVVKQRLLAQLEELNADGERPYFLSFSLGILACEWRETSPLEALLEKADALMYEDKKQRGITRTFWPQKEPNQILNQAEPPSFEHKNCDVCS